MRERAEVAFTGRYVRGDCTGEEKASRINDAVNPTDYDTVYVYGDTAEDREMPELGDVRSYRWKQIGCVP